jgi:hypothetical protein
MPKLTCLDAKLDEDAPTEMAKLLEKLFIDRATVVCA